MRLASSGAATWLSWPDAVPPGSPATNPGPVLNGVLGLALCAPGPRLEKSERKKGMGEAGRNRTPQKGLRAEERISGPNE